MIGDGLVRTRARIDRGRPVAGTMVICPAARDGAGWGERPASDVTQMLHAFRLAAVICAVLPCAALAHPHVFVDVSLTLRYDAQGRLAGIDEVWAYDELYSLLMLTEAGVEGTVDPGQMAALRGLDANWDPLNGGRLTVEPPDGPAVLAQPRHLSTQWQGNRMVTRRRHALSPPVAGDGPVFVRVYDPTYYVNFAMPSQVVIQGRAGCQASLQSGQTRGQDDAYAAALRAALAQELDRAGPDDVQVDIGAVGADSIAVNCGR